MQKKWRNLLIIAAVSLFSTLLLWLPFFLKLPSFWKIALPQEGMATIMKNFDGLYYVVTSKSFYNPEFITSNFSFNLPAIYYSAHFPLYPFLIRLFSYPLGYLWSMISIPLIASVLSGFVFYFFVKEFKYSKYPLWLTIVFLLFPARWLIVRSVGSPEPLLILFLITAFYFFKKKNYWLAGLFGGLAQLTKPPGFLIFGAFATYLIYENWQGIKTHFFNQIIKIVKKAYPLLIIPLTLVGIFTLYKFSYGNFWAYFQSGDNIHLFWPPLQIFNATSYWVGTFWLEEIIYVYFLGALGVVYLFKQKRIDLAIFTTLFFITTLFISHRDIARYSLPLMPFLIIAFEPLLVKKEFKIAFAVIILPIFLYAINFIANNTAPIADWAPFL